MLGEAGQGVYPTLHALADRIIVTNYLPIDFVLLPDYHRIR